MDNPVYSGLIKKIAKLEEDYSLQSLNPLNCGGVADYYTVARTSVELVVALQAAVELKIPYLVIGKGESSLFSDGGFPGMIIENLSSGYAFSHDKTQMVVDSGMPLDQCITLAAGQGMGGLIPWHNLGGTVGGAVYDNTISDGQQILSMLRNVTMFMPKSRKKDGPAIMKYSSDWLKGEGDSRSTKLSALKLSSGITTAQPVIISVIFQLTRVRPDEIRFRLQDAHGKNALNKIALSSKNKAFGPVFEEIEGGALTSLLKEAGVASLVVGNLYPDRYNPNYFRAKGPVQAADIRELTEAIAKKVFEGYLVKLEPRHEYLGVW